MLKIGPIEIDHFPLFLAPMEGVTDPAFRAICKTHGADVVVTEFISSEGIIRDVEKSIRKMQVTPDERPVGIQIFGNNIQSMIEAAKKVEQMQPDFLDINYGCSVKKIVSKGCGASLLGDIPKMVEMTKAVVDAVSIPVTVKTRLGWDESRKEIVDIAERLQDIGIQAITIHGRTKAQIYSGNADWTLIGEVKNNQRMKIPVIGNGDVTDPIKAKEMRDRYGVDGIMIGRGSIGNPWIFQQIKYYMDHNEFMPEPDLTDRVKVCKRHLDGLVELYGDKYGVVALRRHYGTYFKGLDYFKPYRIKLMALEYQAEVSDVLEDILNTYPSQLIVPEEA